jgi:hypothetical protein
MSHPIPTGPQSITLFCESGDGTTVTAELDYNADTGAPTQLIVTNTSDRGSLFILTINGAPSTVRIAPGTRTYTAAQMKAWGLTDVNTQLADVSLASP